MFAGILAGITWGLETVALNKAFDLNPLESMILATLITAFMHDTFSAIFAWIYNGVRGKLPEIFRSLFKTKSGKWVVIAAIIGGPVGMTGYVMTVQNLGYAIGAAASTVFPAIGAVLAFIFLKEKMKWYQWLFLLATLAGVFGLFYSTDIKAENILLGVIGTLLCSFGWGIEAVILAKCLRDGDVSDEGALMIRQTTSAVIYGAAVLPVLSVILKDNAWGRTVALFSNTGWLVPVIVIAGLFATASYLFYYKAIAKIGASKSMALNVSYAAWAMIFGNIYFLIDPTYSQKTEITFLTVVCAIVVLVCSIFAAADFKDIFKRNPAPAVSEGGSEQAGPEDKTE